MSLNTSSTLLSLFSFFFLWDVMWHDVCMCVCVCVCVFMYRHIYNPSPHLALLISTFVLVIFWSIFHFCYLFTLLFENIHLWTYQWNKGLITNTDLCTSIIAESLIAWRILGVRCVHWFMLTFDLFLWLTKPVCNYSYRHSLCYLT